MEKQTDRVTDKQAFKDLIVKYRSGDQKALVTLVEKSMGMVKHMSRKYYNLSKMYNIPLEDLEQECWLGLLGAVSNFPLDIANNDFVSFAFSAMNYQMLDYIRSNSNRIDKYNMEKGFAELESMDKEKCSFGEIEDVNQESAFDDVIHKIDQEILKKNIENMLQNILVSTDDIDLLKDIYGLNGNSYSFQELCSKYNLSFGELIAKERFLILKLKTDKKIQDYLEKMDYTPSAAFHYGIDRFKNSGMSSTEYIALKHIKAQNSLKTQENQ